MSQSRIPAGFERIVLDNLEGAITRLDGVISAMTQLVEFSESEKAEIRRAKTTVEFTLRNAKRKFNL